MTNSRKPITDNEFIEYKNRLLLNRNDILAQRKERRKASTREGSRAKQ